LFKSSFFISNNLGTISWHNSLAHSFFRVKSFFLFLNLISFTNSSSKIWFPHARTVSIWLMFLCFCIFYSFNFEIRFLSDMFVLLLIIDFLSEVTTFSDSFVADRTRNSLICMFLNMKSLKSDRIKKYPLLTIIFCCILYY